MGVQSRADRLSPSRAGAVPLPFGQRLPLRLRVRLLVAGQHGHGALPARSVPNTALSARAPPATRCNGFSPWSTKRGPTSEIFTAFEGAIRANPERGFRLIALVQAAANQSESVRNAVLI